MKIFGIYLFGNPGKHLKLAEKYYEEGKLKEAIEEYKKVLRLDPQNNKAQENLRRIYRQREALLSIFTPEEKESEEEIIKEMLTEKVEPGVVIQQKRRYERVKDNRPINYRLLKNSEVKGVGFNTDISAGGMYLVTKDNIAKGSFLELKFQLGDTSDDIYAIGKVVRVNKIEGNGKEIFGSGIKFTNISLKDQERINKFVEEKKNERKNNNL